MSCCACRGEMLLRVSLAFALLLVDANDWGWGLFHCVLGLRLGRGEEDRDESGVVGYVLKYGQIVRISKYWNAGGSGCGEKDRVEGKGNKYAKMHGYLDA